jgi:hypothetical protein
VQPHHAPLVRLQRRQIAQRLRTHVGKVELILALRGQGTPQPHRP